MGRYLNKDSGKGMSLPVNVIIILAIAILVLVTVSSFFIQSSGQQMSQIDALKIFSSGCEHYCSNKDVFEAAYGFGGKAKIAELTGFDKKFIQACLILGYVIEEERYVRPTQCLKHCGNCDIEITPEEANNDYNQILDSLNNPPTP